ncbi:hypothetical protein RUM43_005631 [Polyplax serrata]|uniref:Uncharacterized protein n=1 Tax=Polyplax serrata TaxID=468196 RepID=A0AAN8PDS9_POLSC
MILEVPQNVDSAATVASLRVPSNPHETGSFGLFLTPGMMFNFLDESKDVDGPSETILRILKSVQSEFPCPTGLTLAGGDENVR